MHWHPFLQGLEMKQPIPVLVLAFFTLQGQVQATVHGDSARPIPSMAGQPFLREAKDQRPPSHAAASWQAKALEAVKTAISPSGEEDE